VGIEYHSPRMQSFTLLLMEFCGAAEIIWLGKRPALNVPYRALEPHSSEMC